MELFNFSHVRQHAIMREFLKGNSMGPPTDRYKGILAGILNILGPLKNFILSTFTYETSNF